MGEDDAAQLGIYYNQEREIGIGVYSGAFSISGFTITEHKCEEWRDQRLSVMTEEHDASLLEEYAEHYTYNERGQLTRFYAEGIIDFIADSPFLDIVVEIEFIFRDDGTLEQKKCYYSPYLFGTSRSTETYFMIPMSD